MNFKRHRSKRQGAEDSYLPHAPMQEKQAPTQQDILRPDLIITVFTIIINGKKLWMGRVRSFLAVLGTTPCAAFVVSQWKPWRGQAASLQPSRRKL